MRIDAEGVTTVSATLDPEKQKGVTPSFRGDVPPERVPEKYRLGRGFVPKARYLDPEFQSLELDKLFTRTWLMVCREEEISRVGSYVEYELGAYSIVVIPTVAPVANTLTTPSATSAVRSTLCTPAVMSTMCPPPGVSIRSRPLWTVIWWLAPTL